MTNNSHDNLHPAHPRHPDLRAIAEKAMQDRGFLVRFPDDVWNELKVLEGPSFDTLKIPDLSSWLWSSIDNDDSKDLDQVEYARKEPGGVRIYIGIADVDWFVPRDSSIDLAAKQNTTSVYTGVAIFPMLPERLSTNLSSLNEGEKRLAMVVEVLVANDGAVVESSNYSAIVENKAQLTYNAVAAWLEGAGATPELLKSAETEAGERTLLKIRASEELQTQLKLQDLAARQLRERRHECGALTFYTSELKPVMSPEGNVIDLQARIRSRASLLIEDLMVAANEATARLLDEKGLPSVRRVVRTPQRWDRIVALAASLGEHLPEVPDARSLELFLQRQHTSDPAHFPDLSLAVIKLLGRGEYLMKSARDPSPGHFGLAVNDYAHSTAPNRRYPDLLTQRLLKAALSNGECPYSNQELSILARHCTEKEDDANKVERFVKKCAAASLLISHIGEEYEGVVSGVSADGTWVRLSNPPVEGKLFGRVQHLDVGNRVRVRIGSVNPEKGFIDFEFLN